MTLPELTYEEFCKLPFTYTFGLSLETGAHRQHTNEQTGVVREIYTPRDPKTWEWGKQQTWFYIKGADEIYTTPDQVYVAYMEKVCGVKS